MLSCSAQDCISSFCLLFSVLKVQLGVSLAYVRQRKENTEEQFMTRLFTDQLETGIIIHDYDHVRPTTQLSPVILNYDDNRKNHCDKNYFDTQMRIMWIIIKMIKIILMLRCGDAFHPPTWFLCLTSLNQLALVIGHCSHRHCSHHHCSHLHC